MKTDWGQTASGIIYLACAFSFGYWQQSWVAGLFMWLFMCVIADIGRQIRK